MVIKNNFKKVVLYRHDANDCGKKSFIIYIRFQYITAGVDAGVEDGVWAAVDGGGGGGSGGGDVVFLL